MNNTFDCNDVARFARTIRKVVYHNSYTLHTVYLCELEGVEFLTKLCFYRKTAPELYGRRNKSLQCHADAEIAILRALKKHVLDAGLSACVLQLLHVHMCNWASRVVNAGHVQPIFEQYRDLVDRGMAHDRFAFLVVENCNFTVRQMLDKACQVNVLRNLLFQILHCLYVIGVKFPGFRHHDLHTDNIMVVMDKTFVFRPKTVSYMVFPVNDAIYHVPYLGLIPKIIDFGFSIMPGVAVSNQTADLDYAHTREAGDVAILLWGVYAAIKKTGGDKKCLALLEQLDPSRTYTCEDVTHRNLQAKTMPGVRTMLESAAFATYRVPSLPIHTQFEAIHDSDAPACVFKI